MKNDARTDVFSRKRLYIYWRKLLNSSRCSSFFSLFSEEIGQLWFRFWSTETLWLRRCHSRCPPMRARAGQHKRSRARVEERIWLQTRTGKHRHSTNLIITRQGKFIYTFHWHCWLFGFYALHISDLNIKVSSSWFSFQKVWLFVLLLFG